MTQIEQIKAEIERQLEYHKGINTAYYMGRRDEDIDMLSYINSLPTCPQESDNCEELEKEIERYINEDSLAVKFPVTTQETELIKSDIRYTAHHFANWQKERFKTTYAKAVQNAIAAMEAIEALTAVFNPKQEEKK